MSNNYIDFDNDKHHLSLDTEEKVKLYTKYKMCVDNNDLIRYKEAQETERKIAELQRDTEIEKNKIKASVGQLGMFFGSGENGKLNFLGGLVGLLVVCSILAAFFGKDSLFDKIIPIITLIVGYIVGQR